MTIVIVAGGLLALGLIGWCYALLVKTAERDFRQLRDNVRVLDGMTASSRSDDRLRVERARHEERDLVRKLSAAIQYRPPNLRA